MAADVDVDAGEGVVAVVLMGEGRYMRGDVRSYLTFVGRVGFGIAQMMVIGVPICERTSVSSSPRIDLYSGTQTNIIMHLGTHP